MSGQDQLKAAGEAIDVPRASRDALHQEHMQFAKAIVHKETETHHDGFGLETGNDWDEAAAVTTRRGASRQSKGRRWDWWIRRNDEIGGLQGWLQV